MAVVKNLMVRIVTDVSSLVKGMKNASSATSQATNSIKNSTSGMKKSVKDTFSTARMSVREYSEYVAKTKQDHRVAAQNVERLTDKIGQMKAEFDSIKSATAGLDLSSSLTKQIQDAEEAWRDLGNESQKVKDVLKKELSAGGSKVDAERVSILRKDLQNLRNAAAAAETELNKLRSVARTIGSQNLQFASNSGLKKLQEDIHAVENELKMAQVQADKTGQRLRSMGIAPTLKYTLKSIGTAAGQAVGGGVKRLGSALLSLGGSALRGIASLPAKLLGIGKSADAGTGGLNRMVRSIRNIGIVSLGLRVASGLFGQLRSIISNYVSQNEALNASVTSLKNQLGEALAPAINIVIAALKKLMPVVTSVANAVNSIFSTIFGNVASTTAAITSSAEAAGSAAESLETYGFDQITKVSDNSSGSGSSGTSGASAQTQEQSALVQKLTGWIQQLKDAFVAGDWEGLGKIVGDGINSAVAAIDAVDVGSKAGKFANNLITTLHSALASTDFYGIGAKAGQMLNNAMQQVDWAKAGDTIGKVMTAIPSIIIGFIQNADWKSVAKNVSELLIGALSSVTEWLRSVDWLQLGQNLWDLISNIDYAGIATSFFTFFGTALGAGVSLIGGFIGGVVDSIKQYFSEKIEECGGNVAKGLLKGIRDGLVGIKTWVVDNIFTPFIECFKSAFGIHSPSTVMEEQGGFLISGLLNGITNAWNSITVFFSGALDALKKTLSAGWEKIKEGASTAWDKVSSTIGGAWENIKTGVSKAGSSVKSNVSDTWNKVKDTVTGKLGETESSAASDWKSITSAAQAAGSSIAASASSDWSSIKQNIISNLSSARNSASGEWATMGAAASTAGSDIKNVASTDWQAVNSFITHNLATARSNAAAAWGDIKSDTNTAADNIASKTKSSFQSVKDGIVSAFSGAWTGAKSWINKLIGGVESMVNFIIRGINKMIGAFNKVASVGSKVGLDLNISEIATVKLPRLATGGIADGPTAAIIGEAGKEAVLPLERNTGWMAQLAQKIVELTGSGNAVSLTIPIYLGGRKVTEYVIKDINQITKSTGVCPVKV